MAAFLPVALAAGIAQFGIIHGAPEPGMDPVAGLGVHIQDLRVAVCTGTLITPRMILTAGHCGGGYDIEMIVALGTAFFGPDLQGAFYEARFEDYAIHPDYEPLVSDASGTDYGSHDVSVLTLTEPVPDVVPALLRRDEITPEAEGMELLSVGWGITGPDADDSGVRRSATVVVDQVWQGFLLSRNDGNPDDANICSGDSGGPQLQVDGERLVEWAVHSWGDSQCAQRSGSTRVDLVYEWILDRVEEVHGSRDLCAVDGFYGDGFCDDQCPDVDPDCLPPEDDPPADDDAEEPPGETGSGCADCQGGGLAVLPLLLPLGLRRRR